MQYTNHQQVPVYATGGEPLMPCHPARARKLMAKGRATPHHVRGIFGIRLLDAPAKNRPSKTLHSTSTRAPIPLASPLLQMTKTDNASSFS